MDFFTLQVYLPVSLFHQVFPRQKNAKQVDETHRNKELFLANKLFIWQSRIIGRTLSVNPCEK